MPIETSKKCKREEVKKNRDKLFVFDENMTRKGFGGQAKACRGEPNTIGIPTRWFPDTSKSSFFTDNDIIGVGPELDKCFAMIEMHLSSGGIVVWPEEGIGTGLADLEAKAPLISRYITNRWKAITERYGEKETA